jgi:hypothetical protein
MVFEIELCERMFWSFAEIMSTRDDITLPYVDRTRSLRFDEEENH